ncbi:S41 family peptidase [Lacihabitans sp. CCS-44]|uniref:S41 family peptidase n=1 Tax=Lacihabitans sp. CCS-44 TaxID=2487331 RepID=UPI0020CE4D44|nr:S41 family peptidase [Lacihabitans sp. CCS-44]MCP9754574.1 S41 family peptidase [Lacihabitans sp. CCS-44]
MKNFFLKTNKKHRLFLLGFLLMGAIGFSAYKVDDRLFEIAKNLDVFATMYKELNALYVDEINPTKAMRVGIQAMLKELDPYTVFYPEDEIEDYFTMNVGAYNGIGATIEYFEGKHVVSMLYEDSPADKAGIKIGDQVLKINNVDVTDKTDAEFGRLLKGQTGTSVKLSLDRVGQSKPLQISVGRDVIKTPNVPHYGMINEEVGYIQLTDFSRTAAKEIKTATLELKDKGMKNLVLDLRGNPGGLLNMAVEICNFYLPKNLLVVETKGKVKEWNYKYQTKEQPLDTDMPIVVLINGRSASASEIVGGTLQDYDRAVLIGQRSFGKGLVQITKDLSYNTKMKVTTSKYYIPSGRCIQAIDYGHRQADGSFGKLPDSLRVPFKTKNGRLVLDGAGIDPDIATKSADQSDYVKTLVKTKMVFYYANKYYFDNQNEKPKENFSLENKTMGEFESWLKNQKFVYETADQKAIDALIKSSKESGDYTKMKSNLDDLKKVADLNTQGLVKKNWEQIKEALELEILSRYYYQKAMKFVAFEKDKDIQEALKLFGNPQKYKSLLAGK